MLTLTLRKLQREGRVQRMVYAEVPPRVDYALTELGEWLRNSIQALGLWALTHRADLKQARDHYDRSQDR